MKNNIFPPEVIEFSSENHFVRNHSKSRIIYIATLLVLFLVLAAFPFVYVDITTQASGIIRTPSENTIIQTTIPGEIEQSIIEENRQVKKGDTLLALRANLIDEEIVSLRARLKDNNVNITDINLLLSGRYPKAYRFISEYREFVAKKNELSTQVSFTERELKRSEALFQKKVIADADYLLEKNKYEMAVKQREMSVNEFRRNWQAEKKRMELENIDLLSQIARLNQTKRNYCIVAPNDGSIIQTTGLKVGSFVNVGQKIGVLSQDEKLIAECYLKPTDIGFIKKNQQVKFQIDAFNYREWGVVTGSVIEISNDVMQLSDNQPVFRVRCKLDNYFLSLHGKYRGNLRKGMTLVGQFYLTKRSISQLIVDRVDDWMNPTQTKK